MDKTKEALKAKFKTYSSLSCIDSMASWLVAASVNSVSTLCVALALVSSLRLTWVDNKRPSNNKEAAQMIIELIK